MSLLGPARLKLGPVGEHHQQRNGFNAVDQQVQYLQRSGVGPMRILEHHYAGLLPGGGFDKIDQDPQRLVLMFLRRYRKHSVALLAGDGQDRGNEPDVGQRPAILGDDQRFQLVEFCVRCFLTGKRRCPFEGIDDWPEGAVHIVRRALEPECLHTLRLEPLTQCVQDAAFADPGLTREQHHLAFAIPRLRPSAKQQIEFLPAAHQRRQRAVAAIGIEAALGRQSTLDPPGVSGFGNPFQLVFAEIDSVQMRCRPSAGSRRR